MTASEFTRGIRENRVQVPLGQLVLGALYMGGTLVRTIGLIRAKAKIGNKNLACNVRRLKRAV